MRVLAENAARLLAAALVCAVGIAAAHTLRADESPQVTRKPLIKQDMTIPGRLAVMLAVELEPGAEEGRHSHPGELYVFVNEGELVLEKDGAEPRTYRSGDAFYVAPGEVHNGINRGSAATRLTAMLIAEKGRPLSAPAQ